MNYTYALKRFWYRFSFINFSSLMLFFLRCCICHVACLFACMLLRLPRCYVFFFTRWSSSLIYHRHPWDDPKAFSKLGFYEWIFVRYGSLSAAIACGCGRQGETRAEWQKWKKLYSTYVKMSEHMIISQASLLRYLVWNSNVSMKTHNAHKRRLSHTNTHTAHNHSNVFVCICHSLKFCLAMPFTATPSL